MRRITDFEAMDMRRWCFFASAPSLPPPPPPPPQRDDPAIIEAREKRRKSELIRKGRGALILTGGQGVTSDAPLSQPRAGAQVLG